ncbi:MAG TPA: enoyl-CoA hydratase [Candidatus Acidoferrales bacterium]|nr:enoyl-CoA hydratase [Candidatus Acidoferrales bacterium]
MGATQQAVSSLLLEERSGPVVTIRLNRPEKLNALNIELSRALVHALLRAGDDKSVRAVVLTGAGRGFCSGGDIGFMRDVRSRRAVDEFGALLEVGKEICLAIATMPKVVIAAVNGPAAGGGMSLALACDLRIASDQAMFKQAFAQLGLYPDLGATFYLPRLVGLSRASEMFYTSEVISAQEACRIGMVYHVFPHEHFDEEVQKFAAGMASGPPLALRDIKRTMIGDAHRELEQAIEEENRLQRHCFLSEDFAEGVAAFFEKRPPKFRGH